MFKKGRYNFELYRFKVGPFFETRCILLVHSIVDTV